MHDRRRILIPVFLVSLLSIIGIGYYAYQKTRSGDQNLQASGTVESVDVLVSPEQAGRVVEVMAKKGDEVEIGEPLLRLDDILLQSQHQRALTSLETAQANQATAKTGLDLAEATLKAALTNVEAAEANAQVELLTAEQALENLYETAAVARGDALQTVASANRAVREAQYQLDNFSVPTNQQQFTAMDAIEVMKERLDTARDRFEPYKYRSSSDPTREDLKEDLDEAQSDYDSAVRRLEYVTELEKAQAQQDQALKDLADLKDGPDPDDVAVLEAKIAAINIIPKQALDAADQARVGVSQAQARLAQAEAAVNQAKAELELIDIQLDKLVIYAPKTGVIISRNVEPGEVVQPGVTVLSIGKLDDLTITVYVPEDRYGQIQIGDQAQVTVDSFPGENFNAVVLHIADRAEFTPRNVQTPDGRRSTVFAVELSVENKQGKLKPGMPADVRFGG